MSERAARAESLVQAQRKILERLEHEEESLARRARAVEAAAQALDEPALERARQTEAELKSRHAEVDYARAELAAERRQLEDEKRLVAELRVSLDHEARASQTVKEELDRHAAELARQAQALAGRASSATVRREAAQADGGEVGSRFTIDQLATLMERRAAEFPDRIEEWQYYLVSLRNVAASDGRLPESVECLVEDVFGPLLDAA